MIPVTPIQKLSSRTMPLRLPMETPRARREANSLMLEAAHRTQATTKEVLEDGVRTTAQPLACTQLAVQGDGGLLAQGNVLLELVICLDVACIASHTELCVEALQPPARGHQGAVAGLPQIRFPAPRRRHRRGAAMNRSANRKLTSLSTIALLAAALAGTAGLAYAADDVTSDQILRALAPKKPLTRGLSMAAPTEPAVNAAEGKFVDTLRNRNTRSLSSGEREQIAVLAQSKPNIDLEITFEYNSAEISAKAQPAVQALGKALSSDELKGSTFIVAGHTDAVGGEAYNQDLSERRPDALKRALTERV
eukprot:gene33234-44490_t